MVLLGRLQAAWRHVLRGHSVLVRQRIEFERAERMWWFVVRQKVVLPPPQWPDLHECVRCVQGTTKHHRAPPDRLI